MRNLDLVRCVYRTKKKQITQMLLIKRLHGDNQDRSQSCNIILPRHWIRYELPAKAWSALSTQHNTTNRVYMVISWGYIIEQSMENSIVPVHDLSLSVSGAVPNILDCPCPWVWTVKRHHETELHRKLNEQTRRNWNRNIAMEWLAK